jgi:hypothetical protein
MITGNALSWRATPGRPPGFQDHEDIRGRMRAGRRQRVAVGGQTSHPWRLSRSVIDLAGQAGAEFARNDAPMGCQDVK